VSLDTSNVNVALEIEHVFIFLGLRFQSVLLIINVLMNQLW